MTKTAAAQTRLGHSILIVTDEYHAHHSFVQLLTSPPSLLGASYVVVSVAPSDVAQLRCNDERFSLVVVDTAAIEQPALLAELRAHAPSSHLLVLGAGRITADSRRRAKAAGAYLIESDLDANQMRAIVAGLVENSQ